MSQTEERWQNANLALACLALDPSALGGLWLRARVGPVRDRFMNSLETALQAQNLRRLHPSMADEALFGGVDLAATLSEGALVKTKGILSEPCTMILPMAERVTPGFAARVAATLDGRGAHALIALDEGAEDEERLPGALADRLAIHLDLGAQPLSDAPELDIDLEALAEARALLPTVSATEEALAELAEVAFRLGIHSLRAPLQALAVARASAALSGETEIDSPDLITAIELVLAPRATQIPDVEQPDAEPSEPEQPDDPPEDETPPDPPDGEQETPDLPPVEMLLEAARAMLPPDLLARMQAGKAARQAHSSSGSGAAKKGNRRGRPLPSRPGKLGGDARVDLVATLRAAAPWQPMRRALAKDESQKLHIRMSDIRVRRFQETSDRAIIFVVDASGSSAMARLGEAKGAIELLLGEAYARRDHVALIAFRGDGSDVLLPPTRSLVQTKRRLAMLPGGGGTPLASGLKSALELAGLAKGKGMTPSVALLTDGRANVDLSGVANRAQAAEDAALMARAIRAQAMPGLVIDTGLRPTRGLDGLAIEMGVPYLPLPRADAKALSAAVDASLTAA